MIKKTKLLRNIIERNHTDYFLGVQSGLSAKIAEEAGFKALWGSSLAMSAECGLRDNNEMSWTQVLDASEFISDATNLPLLLDGDSGYGNFNNVRMLVKKMAARNIAGVCIEDKLFPKQNSFINSEQQSLADIEEFCGKIKAAKDTLIDDDFCIVARTEALVTGLGMHMALKRAEAYHDAGADAILIHSKSKNADEVIEFKTEWGERSPVIIVPTTYHKTPANVFKDSGFSAVIWANQLIRSCISMMQNIANQIHDNQSCSHLDNEISPVKEIFRLQDTEELLNAEKYYSSLSMKSI
jgi:phosphoenolpyruvate phosphomutase